MSLSIGNIKNSQKIENSAIFIDQTDKKNFFSFKSNSCHFIYILYYIKQIKATPHKNHKKNDDIQNNYC